METTQWDGAGKRDVTGTAGPEAISWLNPGLAHSFLLKPWELVPLANPKYITLSFLGKYCSGF